MYHPSNVFALVELTDCYDDPHTPIYIVNDTKNMVVDVVTDGLSRTTTFIGHPFTIDAPEPPAIPSIAGIVDFHINRVATARIWVEFENQPETILVYSGLIRINKEMSYE